MADNLDLIQLPACHRHDFGYTNYREQSRFTESAKSKIDSNFLSEYVLFFHLPNSKTF